jgi:hypothetical protein
MEGSDTLDCEPTGQSQAARGFCEWLYSLLGGCKFSGDRADTEGKSCDGREVGLSVGESARDYATGGKAEGDAEVAIDEFCTCVAMVGMGRCG